MIEMVLHNYIRYLYHNKMWSIRAIAKHCEVHRKTVRRAIQNDDPNYHRSVSKKKPVNGDFEERIKVMLEENWKCKKADKITKFRMYTLLQEEGYRGSYEAFTWETRCIEKALGHPQKEAFVKLLPMQSHLQVDFGEIQLLENNQLRTMFFLCSKLCWSKVEYVQLYPRCSTEFFLDGLVKSFIFYGGIPRCILFDNLTPAVKKILPGEDRILQDSFLRFQSYHCFEARFCAGGKGNQKGRVEHLVGYIKNNYFKPKPPFTGFASMNEALENQCIRRMQQQTLEGKTWEQRLIEEQPQFLPLRDPYECARIVEAKVDTYQLVHVERNRYSVPTSYVGQRVLVKLFPFQVVILSNHKEIARHDRFFRKDEEHLDPYHYLALLEKKTRAYEEAKVIHEWHLPPIYERFHKGIQARVMSKSKGTREFIAILRLTETYGVAKIAKILHVLEKDYHFSFQEVVSTLRVWTEAKRHVSPLPDAILAQNGLEAYRWGKSSLEPYAQFTGKESKS
ncbi:MAG TPA: IS21 family transposase [Caldisericia bacterium]|nr:IS21 family transposase [Caldisericia bacterium]